jgi:hypothetical protein
MQRGNYKTCELPIGERTIMGKFSSVLELQVDLQLD